MIKKISTLLFIILFFFVMFAVVNAADVGNEPIKITGYENLSGNDISGTINKFYKTAIVLGGIAAVLVIVIGGIMYAVSGAINKKNKGKDIIVSAISGLVLLLGAYVILNTVNPQLTKLSNPQYATQDGEKIKGVSSFEKGSTNITGASCAQYPNLEPCEEGENPEQNVEGEWSCCVESNVCSEETVSNCPVNGEKFVVGEGEETQPYCYNEENQTIKENMDPKCVKHNRTGTMVHDCGTQADNIVVNCPEGINPSCTAEGQVICEGVTKETISVPVCNTCEDEWDEWDEITIQNGGVYYKAPYYPMNGDPGNPGGDDGVKCVPYAWKTDIHTDSWKYADLDGLNTCQ